MICAVCIFGLRLSSKFCIGEVRQWIDDRATWSFRELDCCSIVLRDRIENGIDLRADRQRLCPILARKRFHGTRLEKGHDTYHPSCSLISDATNGSNSFAMTQPCLVDAFCTIRNVNTVNAADSRSQRGTVQNLLMAPATDALLDSSHQ